MELHTRTVDSSSSPLQSYSPNIVQNIELWNSIASIEDPQLRATVIRLMLSHEREKVLALAEKEKALAVAEARLEWEQKRSAPSKIHRKPSSTSSLNTLQATTYQQENQDNNGSSYAGWWWWWRGNDSKRYQPLKSHSS